MFDELKNVNRVAPQPIQLPHHEHVTVTEVIQAPIQFGSLSLCAGYAVVGKDALAPGGAECVQLKLRVLVDGADPGVSDEGH